MAVYKSCDWFSDAANLSITTVPTATPAVAAASLASATAATAPATVVTSARSIQTTGECIEIAPRRITREWSHWSISNVRKNSVGQQRRDCLINMINQSGSGI